MKIRLFKSFTVRSTCLLRIAVAFLMIFQVITNTICQEKIPQLVKKVNPSIVLIITYDSQGNKLNQGSGFFISAEGDVITNWHVIHGASSAVVKLASGEVVRVKDITAADKENDLIRLMVDAKDKKFIPLSLAKSLPEVGQRVLVIGSPLGLEASVSDGLVSAVKDVPGFGAIIQISAPISPGSSGSPVINMAGEVIGVATLTLNEAQNLNFAIPAEKVASLTIKEPISHTAGISGTIINSAASVEDLYNKGLSFQLKQDYQSALLYYQKVIEKDENHFNAHFRIGICCFDMQLYNRAEEAFKETIHIKLDYAEAYLNLGIACANSRRYEEAEEVYKQAIRLKPDYAEAYFELGFNYLFMGDKASALDVYKILKDLDEEKANKLFNLIYE